MEVDTKTQRCQGQTKKFQPVLTSDVNYT